MQGGRCNQHAMREVQSAFNEGGAISMQGGRCNQHAMREVQPACKIEGGAIPMHSMCHPHAFREAAHILNGHMRRRRVGRALVIS
jgi:hypothetical protein